MDIKELKKTIEDKTIDNSFKIFIEEDESSRIISNQYINEIAKIFNLNKKFIDNINDIPDNSFIEDNNLYIILCDEWAEKGEHSNCIVVCKKTKDSRAIKIPKLEDWQVVDFSTTKVKGIQKESLDNIISLYNRDYFTFFNDIDKISIFEKSIQSFILDELFNNDLLCYTTNYKIWDLSNAIIKKDINTIKIILKILDRIDVEPLGLVKVLYNNFKTIASIQTNRNVTASDLDISDKQFYVIKKFNCGFYTNDQLINILKLLTNVEYLFKYGEISISELIDYIIIKVLGDTNEM